MKTRRFFATIVAIVMVFAMCSCASAASGEENELGLTGSEMKKIYTAMEEALQKEYLDVNDIKAEDFSIPDDEESWEYFVKCCNEAVMVQGSDYSKEEVKNRISQMVPLSEENQEIMTIISFSFSNSLKTFEKDFLIVGFTIDASLIDLCKELIISNVFAASKTENIQGNSSGKEAEILEAADGEENELGLTENELETIYAAIENNLRKEYLDVNNIKIEDFSIPIDDEYWKDYFFKYIAVADVDYENFSESEVTETVNDLFEFNLPNEEKTIMAIISYTLYDCLYQFDKRSLCVSISASSSQIEIMRDLIVSNVFTD